MADESSVPEDMQEVHHTLAHVAYSVQQGFALISQWDWDKADALLARAADDEAVPLEQLSALESILAAGRQADDILIEESHKNLERMKEFKGPSFTPTPEQN